MCSFFCLASGLVLLLLGAWATQQYFRFTPVYSDIECTFDLVKVGNMGFRGGFHVNLTITVSCDNPNPYTVEVGTTRHLQVYAGKKINPVATVFDLPHATLPAHGKGSITAHGQIAPTSKTVGPVTSALFGGQIPLYVEIELEVSLSLNFIFGNFSATVPFVKDCGLNVQLYPIAGKNTGNLACADSFDDLYISKIDRSPGAALKPQPLSLLDRQLIEAERAKTTGLGTLMGLFYGCALPILAVSTWYIYRLGWCCGCDCCNEEEEERRPSDKRSVARKKSSTRRKSDKSRAKSAGRDEEPDNTFQV